MALDETTKRINVGKMVSCNLEIEKMIIKERKLKAAAEIVPPTVVYGSLIKMMFPTIVYIHVILYCIYSLFPNKKLEVYFEGVSKYVKCCA